MTNHNTDNYLCSTETAMKMDAEIYRLKKKLKVAEAEIDVLKMQVKIIPAPYADEQAMGNTLLKLKAAKAEIEYYKESIRRIYAQVPSNKRGAFVRSQRVDHVGEPVIPEVKK